jgi:hypothetical protein
MEGQRLKAFENRTLKRIFWGRKQGEVRQVCIIKKFIIDLGQ